MIDAESHYRTAQELLGLDRESDRRVAQRLSDALVDHEAIHPEEV
jgi:hypothetical protein